jgi:polar amino acid transport system ATP-binding protein
MIDARDVRKRFGHNEVLRGVSLRVARGEVVAVIGPSGSGKSTFLRCLNHLETIDAELRRICAKTGMVFQHFNLFPHLTVLQNLIEAPMVVQGVPRAEAVARAETLLDKVGLAAKRNNYPSRLSGGQKQRVAIARALCMQPDIMLFDEPTSALDPELTGEVLRTMRELAEERMTMLVVTHEMGFAREVAHTVAFMDQGELIAARPAREFFADPGHERARAFLEHML